MGVDIFPQLYLEERVGSAWVPVALAGEHLERRVTTMPVPYEEFGDDGMAALASFATDRFGLVKRPRRSRGLPKQLSAELRALYDEAHASAVASLEELADEHADDLSLGEGWITPEELARVRWDGRPSEEEPTYRELFGPTFFAQIARVATLAERHTLRVVFWFTC